MTLKTGITIKDLYNVPDNRRADTYILITIQTGEKRLAINSLLKT